MITITQLEYIVSLDKYRNFVEAARRCFVTQPTLSIQIQKLEDYLQISLFDRTKKPVVPTSIGKEVIQEAKLILQNTNKIEELVNRKKGEVKGDFHLGIIPSVAGSIIPLFLESFINQYPDVDLYLYELQTEAIIEKLKSEEIDAGIASTPLEENSLKELPLYNERLFTYLYKDHPLTKKEILSPKELDINEVLIMAEGHCFKNQTLELCRLKKSAQAPKIHFESNNFQTLINLVDKRIGISLLPELILPSLSSSQRNNIRPFKNPSPIREISFVYRRSLVKESIFNSLNSCIKANLPANILLNKKGKILSPL